MTSINGQILSQLPFKYLWLTSLLQLMCSTVISQEADRRIAYGLLVSSPQQAYPMMPAFQPYYASPSDGGYGPSYGGGYGGYGGGGAYGQAMGWASPYGGYGSAAPAAPAPQQQSLASLMNPLFGGSGGGSYAPLISSLLGR